MSIVLRRTDSNAGAWALSFSSITLGGLLLVPGGHFPYLVGLTVTATVAGLCIAFDDYRTGLLRNRWTAPFALAGLFQVVIAAAGTQAWARIAAPCLLGAVITTSIYLLLGLLGWVGFGDVKFAAGLALFVAIPAGWAGLYLVPVALSFSALHRLFRRLAAKPQKVRSAHGPALAVALALLMSAACLGHH